MATDNKPKAKPEPWYPFNSGPPKDKAAGEAAANGVKQKPEPWYPFDAGRPKAQPEVQANTASKVTAPFSGPASTAAPAEFKRDLQSAQLDKLLRPGPASLFDRIKPEPSVIRPAWESAKPYVEREKVSLASAAKPAAGTGQSKSPTTAEAKVAKSDSAPIARVHVHPPTPPRSAFGNVLHAEAKEMNRANGVIGSALAQGLHPEAIKAVVEHRLQGHARDIANNILAGASDTETMAARLADSQKVASAFQAAAAKAVNADHAEVLVAARLKGDAAVAGVTAVQALAGPSPSITVSEQQLAAHVPTVSANAFDLPEIKVAGQPEAAPNGTVAQQGAPTEPAAGVVPAVASSEPQVAATDSAGVVTFPVPTPEAQLLPPAAAGSDQFAAPLVADKLDNARATNAGVDVALERASMPSDQTGVSAPLEGARSAMSGQASSASESLTQGVSKSTDEMHTAAAGQVSLTSEDVRVAYTQSDSSSVSKSSEALHSAATGMASAAGESVGTSHSQAEIVSKSIEGIPGVAIGLASSTTESAGVSLSQSHSASKSTEAMHSAATGLASSTGESAGVSLSQSHSASKSTEAMHSAATGLTSSTGESASISLSHSHNASGLNAVSHSAASGLASSMSEPLSVANTSSSERSAGVGVTSGALEAISSGSAASSSEATGLNMATGAKFGVVSNTASAVAESVSRSAADSAELSAGASVARGAVGGVAHEKSASHSASSGETLSKGVMQAAALSDARSHGESLSASRETHVGPHDASTHQVKEARAEAVKPEVQIEDRSSYASSTAGKNSVVVEERSTGATPADAAAVAAKLEAGTSYSNMLGDKLRDAFSTATKVSEAVAGAVENGLSKGEIKLQNAADQVAQVIQSASSAGAKVSLEDALSSHMKDKGFDAQSIAAASQIAQAIREDMRTSQSQADSVLVLHKTGTELASVVHAKDVSSVAAPGDSVLAMDTLEKVAAKGLDQSVINELRGGMPDAVQNRSDLELAQSVGPAKSELKGLDEAQNPQKEAQRQEKAAAAEQSREASMAMSMG